MVYLAAGAIIFTVGIAVGLKLFEREINEEIKLRKKWQSLAKKLGVATGIIES